MALYSYQYKKAATFELNPFCQTKTSQRKEVQLITVTAVVIENFH